MQQMSYYCDNCGCHINSYECPIVAYMVVGHVNGGGEVDTSHLHPYVKNLLERPVSRVEFCAQCIDEAMFNAFLYTHPDDHNPETIAALEARIAKLGEAKTAAEARLLELQAAV